MDTSYVLHHDKEQHSDSSSSEGSTISASSSCILDLNDETTNSDSDRDDGSVDSTTRSDDMLIEEGQDRYSNLRDVNDLMFLCAASSTRSEPWDHTRLNWADHVTQLLHEGRFQTEYLMSPQAYCKLVHILDPILERAEYNSRSTEPIQVEHIMAIGLRVLGGGVLKDNRHVGGMSIAAAYVAFDDFIEAVNSASQLDIHLPKTHEELMELNREWRLKSTNEVIAGAVTAIDGFFQGCNKPRKRETSNPMSYRSGHYHMFGVNCQACVRANLQFLYFGVVAPGSTNDNIAFPQSPGLQEFFDSLPLGFYGLGDAAYTLSDRLLTPFTGSQRHDPAQDAFNYYLSQLRIRVEMAFGRMVNKFRILSGKIVGPLDRVSAILTASARLHNFIIKEDGPFGNELFSSVDEEMQRLNISSNVAAPLGMSYLPVVPDETFEPMPGVSHIRDSIVEHLRDHQIGRPVHNIERRKQEMEDERAAAERGDRNLIACDREFVSP